MKSFLRDLFSENSSVSMMRVMSLIALVIGGYLALQGKNDTVGIFVGAAFSGKVLQKAVELNSKGQQAGQ
jgi:Na+(H+)/acetate symporter ActP